MPISTPCSRRSILAVATAAGVGASAAARAAGAADEFDAMRRAAEALIRRGATPGMMVAVASDWRAVFRQGFGLANLEWSIPVSNNTVFRIGSMTKQFTAAAILRLQELGKLSLDDRLARYLPDFPEAGKVSLRHLLTHTSGLHNFTEDLDNLFVEQQDLSLVRFIAVLAKRPVVYDFEPGTAQHYSNTAFVLLGSVIATAADESYAAFLQREVLDRAGLKATTIDHAGDVVRHRASGYAVWAPNDFHNAPFMSMNIPGAAGALRSTADDLLVWHKTLFAGQVVSRDSLATMLAPARLNDGSLAADSPYKPLGKHESGNYGMGLFVTELEGETLVRHLGGINGFTADTNTFPRLGLSIAVLCNGPPAEDFTRDVLPGLLRTVIGAHRD